MDFDLSYLQQTLQNLKAYYATRDAWFDEFVDAYFGSVWETSPTEEEERITLPTGFTIIEMARSLMTARSPVISVPPSAHKKVAEDRADRVEKYCYALWEQANMVQVLRDCAWSWFTLGWAVCRVTWDETAAKRDELPVLLQYVYPGSVYANFNSRGQPSCVFFTQDMTIRSILAEWGEQAEEVLGGRNLEDEVELVDWWEVVREGKKERVYNAVYVEDRFIREPQVMPHYPAIPYVIGRMQAAPIPGKGEYEGISFLFPLVNPNDADQSLLRYRNRLFSQLAQVVADYADPVLVLKSDYALDESGRPGFAFDHSHGAINSLRRDEEAYYLQWQGNPPAVQAQWQMCEREIEKASFPPALFGQYAPDMSGIALNVLTTPTMAKVAAHQHGLRLFLEECFRQALRLTEANIKGTMPFWTRGSGNNYQEIELRKADIGGYYRVNVRLSADLPKDVPAMLAIIANLKNAGLISQHTGINLIQQYLDTQETSVDDEYRNMLREAALSSPEARQAMARAALKEYGLAAPTEEQSSVKSPEPPAPGGLPPEVLPGRAAPATTGGIEQQLAMMGLPGPPGEEPLPYGGYPHPGGNIPLPEVRGLPRK